MFCKAVCQPSDPTTDTVKVDFAARFVEADPESREDEERRRQEEATELARQQAEQAEEERRRLEDVRRRRIEEAKERAAAETKRIEAEKAQRAEMARKQREQQEAEEARRREEAKRAEAERAAQEKRKAAIAVFLKEYGFASVTAPRRKLTKTNYALHKAAKLADAELVEMLLLEGADAQQKDSRGKTPGQVAQAKDSKGSHNAVIALLGGRSQAPPTVGGA